MKDAVPRCNCCYLPTWWGQRLSPSLSSEVMHDGKAIWWSWNYFHSHNTKRYRGASSSPLKNNNIYRSDSWMKMWRWNAGGFEWCMMGRPSDDLGTISTATIQKDTEELLVVLLRITTSTALTVEWRCGDEMLGVLSVPSRVHLVSLLW